MNRHLLIRGLVLAWIACAILQIRGQPSSSFVNFETAPVHPVALSPDGALLALCNLPDGRLELFSVNAGSPSATGNVPVGIDPVSVRFRTTNEVWVVNHISASVSIVDLSARRVAATLETLTGPADVVFAGHPQRAFVSCAGANTIQVFDPASRTVVTNLSIEAERPKAMAVSPDGARVYVAVFGSGNGTTILAPPFTINMPEPGPLGDPSGPYQGQNPPPNAEGSFSPPLNPNIPEVESPPTVSQIVRKNATGRWLDDNSRDWTEYIAGTNAHLSGRIEGWDLPDRDVAVIDADTGEITYLSGLMNICMDLAVNPATGKITVVGTEATNERRFESNLRSAFLRVNLALVDPETFSVEVKDLNSHLDYIARTIPSEERNKSVGDPRGIIWHSSGTLGYVSGMGSGNLVMIDAQGNRVQHDPIELEEGPSGLALDEPRRRLYVLNRFSASLSVVDTGTQTVLTNVPLFDPTPAEIKRGRPHLYDTRRNSGLGHVSCASCHVDARMDRLAWDLGDPSGEFLTIVNYLTGPFGGTESFSYHPMKGPMVTQTLQDIIGHEPFHWRGDRTAIEEFNPAFTNLLGRDALLTDEEMAQFKAFLRSIHFPPNPFRNLDDTLPEVVPLPGHYGVVEPNRPLVKGDPRRGSDMFFFTSGGDNQCNRCHEGPAGLGSDRFFRPGPNGERHIGLRRDERTLGLPFKIPQLRNLHEKVGLDYDRNSSRTGFGLTHDGRQDTLSKFLFFGSTDPVRYFRNADPSDEESPLDIDRNIADLIAFLFCFSGSNPVMNPMTHPERAESQDVATATGRQFTTTVSNAPLFQTFLRLADSPSNRLDLVVRGEKDGLARGWYFAGHFISDRLGDVLRTDQLAALASPTNPLTFTLVPRGSGRRIGIDRDNDGWPDRTEIDAGFDPANSNSHGASIPPRLTLFTNYVPAHAGTALTFSFAVSDPDTPPQALGFELLPDSPVGASLNPSTGEFSWLLPASLVDRKLTRIYLRVTETNWPFHSDIKAITLESVPLLLVPLAKTDNEKFGVRWQTIPGRTYLLQYKSRISDPEWSDWPRPLTADLSQYEISERDRSPVASPQMFIRVRLEP